MKTNPSARRLLRIRLLVICAALAAVIGLEVRLSESLAARVSRAAACQSDSFSTADVSISDLMAAAR
jgi:hypothetical protein